MSIRTRLFSYVALFALTGLMNGCGGGTSAPTSSSYVQTGKSVQGPVSGARIFADRLEAGVRFVEDGGEIFTTTNPDGSYTLPTLPNYNYIIVSQGGEDTFTHKPALQMLAPAGSRNITPLTTLVALDAVNNPTLDPTKGVLAKIKALLPAGVEYDTDISVNSSPAVLLLVKSVEASARSLSDALETGNATRKAYIQTRIMQAIATTLSDPGTSAADIATPSILKTKLTAALGVALTNILTDNNNIIAFSNPADKAVVAGNVATSSVNATIALLGITDQNAVQATATKQLESSFSANVGPFNTAIAGTVTVIVGSSITVVITPNPFSPPTIPVVSVPIAVIVTGATGSTGSTGTGTQF